MGGHHLSMILFPGGVLQFRVKFPVSFEHQANALSISPVKRSIVANPLSRSHGEPCIDQRTVKMLGS